MNQDDPRRRFLAGAGTAALAALAGCVVSAGEERESIEETYDAADRSALRVATRNGDLTVTAEDRSTVAVAGEKTAASEGDLETIRLEESREGGVLDLSVERDAGRFEFRWGSSRRLDLEVTVPEDLRVERVATRNGGIDVTGVTGDAAVETRNGVVGVREVTGDLELETRNGDVEVAGVDGDLVAESRNGDLRLRDVAGDLTVETRDGAVDVDFEGSLDAALDLETRTGEVAVTGGSDVDSIAATDAVETTVGDGSRRIEIETRTGDVTITAGE